MFVGWGGLNEKWKGVGRGVIMEVECVGLWRGVRYDGKGKRYESRCGLCTSVFCVLSAVYHGDSSTFSNVCDVSVCVHLTTCVDSWTYA